MLQLLSQLGYKLVLSDCISTLNPKLRLGGIRYCSCSCHLLPVYLWCRDKECRFYDSKMRPLLMVYENPDPSGADIKVIFKNGDGKN